MNIKTTKLFLRFGLVIYFCVCLSFCISCSKKNEVGVSAPQDSQENTVDNVNNADNNIESNPNPNPNPNPDSDTNIESDFDSNIGSEFEVSEFQKHTLYELNMARTNPQLYAEKRLWEEYQGGNDSGAYSELISRKPILALKLNHALNISATNYAAFLATHNLFSHHANGSPSNRCNQAGYEGLCAENLAKNSDKDSDANINPKTAAINFVKQLIIDHGIYNRGHRKIILNDSYVSVGIGYAKTPNSKYSNVTVQNFGKL